jgi:polyhydroxybutyrate depolymerase
MRSLSGAAALCAILAVLLTACVQPPPETNSSATPVDQVAAKRLTATTTVEGTRRQFLIRVPAHRSGEKLPVIVALHPALGNAARFETTSGFTRLTATDHFIAVYPNGTALSGARPNAREWNAGTCCGIPQISRINDMEFLGAIFDNLAARVDVDAQRIFLAGFSNGGMLAYRAACELGSRIAGIAVVAGALNVKFCPSTNAMPVMIIHGTADEVVPFRGGTPVHSRPLGLKPWVNESVAEALSAWKKRDGCASAPIRSSVGQVREELYLNCASDTFINLRIIVGGSHHWPTGAAALIAEQLLGKGGR